MSLSGTVRELWLHAISATMSRPSPGAAERARRVLVLRHDRIGDMLSTLPLLRALTEHGLEVDVLASASNAPVLEHNPWGIRVHVAARGLVQQRKLRRTLRARGFDAVIDALALKPAVNSGTVRLLAMSGAPVRVGIGGRRHGFVFTHPVAPRDRHANHVELLAELATPFGVRRESALRPTPLTLTEEERRRAREWWDAQGVGPRLCVNLSAGGMDRRWPDSRFTAVLVRLLAEYPGTRVGIVSAPSEHSSAVRVANAVGGVAAEGALRDVLALISESDLVLSPDTSVVHAAAGFQVPGVVLISQRQLQFAPWRAPGRLVVTPGDRLDAIHADDVLAALRAELPGALARANERVTS